MAFTKVTAAGISSTPALTIDGINSVGVVTASTVQVGSATTIHTTGIDLGSGNITSHNINSTGIITATGAVITGNLQVDGTTTTLDTIVTEVDKLEVSANNTNVAVAVTQSGTGDILRLYDGATQVVTVTDVGGNVGIGITNPETALHIKRGQNSIITLEDQDTTVETDSVVGALYFKNLDNDNGGINAYIGGYNENTNGAMYLSFGTGTSNSTTERVRITSGGLVGIGTDDPLSLLSLHQTGGGFEVNANSGSNNARLLSYDRSASAYREMTFQALSYGFEISGSEKLRINSSGNVGIGTNNPGTNLDVLRTSNDTGGIVVRNTNNSQANARAQVEISGGDNADGRLKIECNGTEHTFRQDGSGNLQIHNASAERLRITSTGKIGIATDNPFGLLTAAATVDTSVFAIAGNLGNNNGRAFQILTPTEDSTTSPFRIQTGNSMLFQTDANNCLYLGDFGHVGIHTLNPTFGQSSPISTYDPKFGVQGSIMIGNLSTTASDRHELQFYRRNGAAGQPIDTHDMGRIAWYGSNNDTDNAGLAWSIGVNPDGGSWFAGANRKGYMTFNNHDGEQIRIQSDGTLDLKYGVINLGTADSSSGHINAYELMSFNIDSDNDDSTRHFTWYKNGASANGTGMMRLNEDGRLGIGGDLATSANNLTLKHATTTEIDMHCTGGSGNNFRLKSDSAGVFTIRDHSSGNDRLTILDGGNVGIGTNNPDGKLAVTGNGYNQINIANNNTANNNKLAGITGQNYVGDKWSIIQTYSPSGSNQIYYGSADGNYRGATSHYFYVNSDPNATTGHTEVLRLQQNQITGTCERAAFGGTGRERHQILSGKKTFSTTSNTYLELFRCGHSHSIQITYQILQGEDWSKGGAHGRVEFFTLYGSSSGPINHAVRRIAMNGGQISGDPEFHYLNSGGATSYLIRCRVPFTSTSNGTFAIAFTVNGLSSDTMYVV